MYLLSDTVVQVAVQEERLGSQEVEGDTHGIDEGDRPEGSTIAQVLGNDATQEDAQSHTDIPRDEDGGVGRAALVIVCHIDGHILKCRPHV